MKKKNVHIITQFETAVIKGLQDAGIVDLSQLQQLGVAVSGGADSLSLLFSLAHIAKQFSFSLSVITIDHRIRSEEESSGDALFVRDCCSRLQRDGFPVACVIKTLAAGEVAECAAARKKGIEEAARFLRYQAFEQFVADNGLPYICLAHTQNDQLETLLMRFIQGSSSSGILPSRSVFVRPLLAITRVEIEAYLLELHQSWRTDSTNTDNQYLRNRIRNVLVPCLNDNFTGWQHAVLSGAQRCKQDESFFDIEVQGSLLEVVQRKTEHSLCLNASLFYTDPDAIKRRILFWAFTAIGCEERVPFSTVCAVLRWEASQIQKITFSDIVIALDGATIFIEKHTKTATQCSFFAILYGKEDFADLHLDADYLQYIIRVGFPCCLRTRQVDDVVMTADGSFRALNDIYASWHVPDAQRDTILVVQELYTQEQRICCICGKLAGYEDWIVK